MDNNIIAILIVILIVVIAVGLWVIYQRVGKQPDEDKGMQFLQQQLHQLTQMQNDKLDRLNKELNERLRDQDKTLYDQLQRSNASIQKQFELSQKGLTEYTEKLKQVTQEITKVGETGKNIQGFASQLQSLENILRNPKQRGVLGEYFLETVLKNVLPPEAYRIQYRFKNGEIVDALIITKDGYIPIDAKFSLENYNRLVAAESKSDREALEKQFKLDLTKRIDETSKYIRPEEGTLDFAFMFIPADGLYYDLLVQKVGALDINSEDLIKYAFKKKVLIVSPTTFFAYLQTVMQGLRALKIEESTKQIQKHVDKLQKHLMAYTEHYGRVGKLLSSTVTAYNTANKELQKVDKDILNISGGDSIVEDSTDVERPSLGAE